MSLVVVVRPQWSASHGPETARRIVSRPRDGPGTISPCKGYGRRKVVTAVDLGSVARRVSVGTEGRVQPPPARYGGRPVAAGEVRPPPKASVSGRRGRPRFGAVATPGSIVRYGRRKAGTG